MEMAGRDRRETFVGFRRGMRVRRRIDTGPELRAMTPSAIRLIRGTVRACFVEQHLQILALEKGLKPFIDLPHIRRHDDRPRPAPGGGPEKTLDLVTFGESPLEYRAEPTQHLGNAVAFIAAP